MYNLFVDRNIDNERGPAIVDDLKRRILVYEFFVFLHRSPGGGLHPLHLRGAGDCRGVHQGLCGPDVCALPVCAPAGLCPGQAGRS